MLPHVIAGLFGAWFVGRTKPRTKVEKKTCLGPRSGVTYQVEDFPSAGFLVVKAPDGSQGVFTRAVNGPGLEYARGRGNPQTMQLMIADFTPVRESPRNEP